MNEDEALELTGLSDPLTASDMALEWVDLVLCTAGPNGLYMAGYTEEANKRQTQHPLLPGHIAEFNRYEFSRAMRREHCENPLRVYSHIAPYMGGPERIMNTNGAGDGALSALLHDIAANGYHRHNVPNSSKHVRSYLTYSLPGAGVQIRQPRQLPGVEPAFAAPHPWPAGAGRQPGRVLLGALTR